MQQPLVASMINLEQVQKLLSAPYLMHLPVDYFSIQGAQGSNKLFIIIYNP